MTKTISGLVTSMVATTVLFFATSPDNITLGEGFTGITAAEAGSNPADVGVAYGPDGYLVTSNYIISAYLHNGTRIWTRRTREFYNATSEVIDQHPIYHYGWRKWVVTGVSNQTVIIVASTTLQGPWQVRHLNEGRDYPTVGYNNESLFITYNGSPNLLVLDRDLVTTTTAPLPSELRLGGVSEFARHDDAPLNSPAWTVRIKNSGRDILRLHRYSNGTWQAFDVRVPKMGLIAPVYADGTFAPVQSIPAWWARPMARTIEGRTILTYAVALPEDGGTRNKAHYFIIDVTGDVPVLLHTGKLGAADRDAFNVAVAINRRGDVGITYLESSLTTRLTMFVGAIRSDGVVATPVPCRVSDTPWLPNYRLGDYATMTSDGFDFIAGNHYALTTRTPNWAVWVQKFRYGSLPPLTLEQRVTSLEGRVTILEQGGGF